MSCPTKKHGRQQYQILLRSCQSFEFFEGHYIADAESWLCELQCLAIPDCNRKWLACRLCEVSFPGKGNLSGEIRKRDAPSRRQTLDSLILHSESQAHKTLLAAQAHLKHLTERAAGSTERFAGTVDASSNLACDSSPFGDDSEQGSSPSLDPPPPPATVENTTSQSHVFTTKLLREIAELNCNLGNFVMKEDTEKFLGARYIVSMACEENCRRGDAWQVWYSNPAPIYGTEFMFAYTQIFHELSVKSRRKFVRILDVAMDALPTDRLGPKFGRATIPRTLNSAYRICLRGSHAITESLPLPRIVTVGSRKEEHACVYPLDVVQYAFATLPAEALAGIPFVTKDHVAPVPAEKVDNYFQSSDYCAEVSQTVESLKTYDLTATILIMVRWFSDGWDPNSTKNNRNGVWSLVMTVMLGPNAGMKEVVFPLAVGPKSADHAPALDWVLGHVESLSDEYHIVRDVPNLRNARIRFATALIQVDRLEKEELLGSLHHASNRGKSHGVVAAYETLHHESYRPCSRCVKKIVILMLESDLSSPLPDCEHCACYDPTSSLLMGPVPPPIATAVFPFPATTEFNNDNQEDSSFASLVSNSPWLPPPCRPVPCVDAALPDSAPDVPQKYGPVKVDQIFLIVACRFVSYHTWTGAITTKTLACSWADVCGISHSVMLPIFEEARKHKDMGTVDFTDVFTKELLPPIWLHKHWDLHKFLHAPMHLLFLGVMKKVMEMIDEWLALHSLKTSFNTAASAACDAVGKVNLVWLKLLKFGASTLSRGLWVSEQYLSFSKFMFIPILGLTLAKSPHPKEIECILRVVDSLFVLLSLVMKREVTPDVISRTKIAIRLYLFAVDDFGCLLFSRSKKSTPYIPISLGNPNHASLIAMVYSMSTHGPPCDMWDGKEGCEASIQTMKRFFVSTCMVDGASVAASLKQYYRHRYLDEMGDYMEANGSLFSGSDFDKDPRNRYGAYTFYPRHVDVMNIFAGNLPLGPGIDYKGAVSGLLYENTTGLQVVAVMVGSGLAAKPYRVELKEMKSTSDLIGETLDRWERPFAGDFCFFGKPFLHHTEPFVPADGNFHIVTKVCIVEGKHIWNEPLHCHVPVCLPDLKKLFTIITDDYRKMDIHGYFSEYPSVSKKLWSDIASCDGEFIPTDWGSLVAPSGVDLWSMTVAQLKEILREHGKRLTGRKPDLVERVSELYESIAHTEGTETTRTAGSTETATSTEESPCVLPAATARSQETGAEDGAGLSGLA